MGVHNYSKGKDHALLVQGSKKFKSKDEDSYEDLMKKVKKKGRTYKCSYCSKGFHSEKKCFNKKMDIMS